MILWLSKMLADFMLWSSSSYLLSRFRRFFTPIKKEHILIATGGESGTGPGGTMTRQAHKRNNDTTYFRSYIVLLLQDLMAWVNADNSVEVWVGSTPPTTHSPRVGGGRQGVTCFVSLACWRRWRRWQSQALRVALHQRTGRAKENCSTNRWVHIAGTGRSLKSWWPMCWASGEPLIPQAGIQKCLRTHLLRKWLGSQTF